MIISMTGYGRGVAQSSKDRVIAEVRVLNSRYLDYKLRGIELPADIEMKVREKVRNAIVRGSVNVTFSLESDSGKTESIVFNRGRFEAMENILTSIHQEYGRQIDLNEVITASDLFLDAGAEMLSSKAVLIALDKALQQVAVMRKNEGSALQDDLNSRLASLEKYISEIDSVSAKSPEERKTILEERLKDLVGNLKLDESRIYQEVAILADKYDISEEITRSRSHFAQFRELFSVSEPAGKRLNFLLQEIGREVNTIGSKTNHSSVIKLVVEIKDQIEKMREQVQNVL